MDFEDLLSPLPKPDLRSGDLVDVVEVDGTRRRYLIMERRIRREGYELSLLADPENP
jgi:hypothetical protein